MFDVMRCKTCGKLRLWGEKYFQRDTNACSKCGGAVYCGAGYYTFVERVKLLYWCVTENWAEGNIRSTWNIVQAIGMGLRPGITRS